MDAPSVLGVPGSGLLALSVQPGDHRPVDPPPPGLEVVGPAVLVLEVVSMLPHVAGQQGAQGQRRVLVAGLAHGQGAVPVADQPGPPGAEHPQGGGLHGGFQGGHPAQIPLRGGGQGRVRPLSGVWSHALEVQRVVVYAPGVVADALSDVLRQAAPVLAELLQRPVLTGGTGGQQLVQIVYVSSEMLVVVEMESLFVDFRQQIALSIGQRRQRKGVMRYHHRSS